jgi:hypothetical protein
MNQELIDMANQAGWQYAHGDSGYEPLWKFAALVAAAERKACAKLCEEQYEYYGHDHVFAKAIRARGETK